MTRMRTARVIVAVLFALIQTPLHAQERTEERTYVIVHGAWGGVANWLGVERLLISSGHRAYLAELTGHGERVHLQNASIDLETHIMDVVGLIEERNLNDVYLVGHSYGGMVITGVWDRLRDRIRHVVYLDAFLPEDGKSVSDYMVSEEGGALSLPQIAAFRSGDLEVFAGFVSPAYSLTPSDPPTQSVRTFVQPLVFRNGPLPSETPKTYVRAVGNTQVHADPNFRQFADGVRTDATWNYLEIMTGHMIPLQDLEGLVDILLEVE
jgi:pimeloyl-ACP methyl ester carboxylesterase